VGGAFQRLRWASRGRGGRFRRCDGGSGGHEAVPPGNDREYWESARDLYAAKCGTAFVHLVDLTRRKWARLIAKNRDAGTDTAGSWYVPCHEDCARLVAKTRSSR
jgi:hypothetical protein